MIRSHKTSLRRKALLLNLAATALILTAGAFAGPSTALAQTASALPVPQGTPAALIKKIVVKDQIKTQTDTNQATVMRGGKTVRVVLPFLLYLNDVIETFADTQVTVLFFNSPASTHDNEIIIDAKSKVGISSSDSWWGTIWAKVKDAFTSETHYARLSAKGTEYEFTVCKPGERSIRCTGDERSPLVVLEGQVEVSKGTFRLAGESASLAPELLRSETGVPRFLFAEFALGIPAQEQPSRVVDTQAGTKDEFEVTYNIFNECHQPHHFEFRTSDSTEWLQLEVEKRMEIAAGQRLAVKAKLKIDASQLSPGPYGGHVYVLCLDCNLERGCAQAQLDWTYRVNVKPSGMLTPVQTPTVTPTPPNQVFTVKELEASDLTRGFDTPTPATDARVLGVLDWTNKVILTTQPSYSAQNIIPHFSTIEQRSQSFRDARPRAILKHESGSNIILGGIYSDWGQGAWAVAAYNREANSLIGQQGPSASFLIDRAEAYRLTGQLGRARDVVLSTADSQSPAARNLFGNIAFDNARIALDKGDSKQSGDYLEQARTHYASALSTNQTTGQGGFGAGNTTIKTNLAKTQIAQGDLTLQASQLNNSSPQVTVTTTVAPQANAVQLAKTKYSSAIQLLADTQQADSTYPFGVTELGRAYQGLGHAAVLEKNAAAANESYGKAKGQYNRVITAHPDCAEAYFNLGDLSEDMGDKEGAKNYYQLAIKARPEQPASYYPLALLLQKENPQLAAALAATYLQLEAEDFKQGQKAENARLITQNRYVTPPERPDSRAIPPNENSNVDVPLLMSNDRETAITKITGNNLKVGKITEQVSCGPAGQVLAQEPPTGTPVAPFTSVNITVSALGENPVTVPNLNGRKRDEAETVLSGLGLRLNKVESVETDDLPMGIVIDQNPKHGSRLAQGCSVDIFLVKPVPREKPVEVPNVVGMDLKEAKALIESRQLLLGTVQYQYPEPDKPRKSNTVISQSRAPNQLVAIGTSIDLVVAK